MNAIGDMATYQAYQLGQAMPVAAANPAGGLAGAGVGLGMGMAMAGPMLRPGPQTPPPPPAPASWHVAENGRTLGPFTLPQLAQAAAEGRFRPDTLVWTAGMTGWSAAATLTQLAGVFEAQPPPPPGAEG
jgi:hypothetical protein